MRQVEFEKSSSQDKDFNEAFEYKKDWYVTNLKYEQSDRYKNY